MKESTLLQSTPADGKIELIPVILQFFTFKLLQLSSTGDISGLYVRCIHCSCYYGCAIYQQEVAVCLLWLCDVYRISISQVYRRQRSTSYSLFSKKHQYFPHPTPTHSEHTQTCPQNFFCLQLECRRGPED